MPSVARSAKWSVILSKTFLKLSFLNYALWWKRRAVFSFSAVTDGSSLNVEGNNTADDTFIRISLPNNKETIVPPNVRTSIDEVQWKTMVKTFTNHPDIMRTRKRTVRHYIQNVLDWWIKTTE